MPIEQRVLGFPDDGHATPRDLVDQPISPAEHPVGTCFLAHAKLTDRLGGEPYLYVYHGDPIVVLSDAQARKFLAEFRRGRI